MTIEQILRDAGAKCVAGDLILDHKVVGHYRNGEFAASLEGIAFFEDANKARQEEILAAVREQTEEAPRRGRRPRVAVDNYTAGGGVEPKQSGE